MIRFLCHKWAAVSGDHVDFVTATELGRSLEEKFSKKVPFATLCLWLGKEKNAYLRWKNKEAKEGELKPVTSKGKGLLPLLALIREKEDEEDMLAAKLRHEREHASSKFTLDMRKQLKLELAQLKDVPGFGRIFLTE